MRLTPVRIALHFGAWFLCVTVPTYSTAQTTHEFSATTYYNTFSFDHPVALRISPGDRVVTKTIDARGGDENGRQVAPGPNPQIGPFYVEGAEPGDVLVVKLEKIEPNRDTAYSSSVLAPYAADPAFLRYEALHEQQTEIWELDLVGRMARPTISVIRSPRTR